jgi:dipeptidyl aminopeptidase/acylaminoacyl peptidase
MRIDFDETTQSWGEPQMVLDCAQRGLSVSVPRVSPDGRYILLTLGEFGQFHIWHKSSDLYVWDIQKEELRSLEKTNSADVDSYHSWSSNGRWMVFSSRRDDGSYTRPYIAYFDQEGNSYKAFMLPQEDPEDNLMRLKSYNVPELTKDAIQINSSQLRDVIYADEKARKVAYK